MFLWAMDEKKWMEALAGPGNMELYGAGWSWPKTVKSGERRPGKQTPLKWENAQNHI